jgi:hypothetical protein
VDLNKLLSILSKEFVEEVRDDYLSLFLGGLMDL